MQVLIALEIMCLDQCSFDAVPLRKKRWHAAVRQQVLPTFAFHTRQYVYDM